MSGGDEAEKRIKWGMKQIILGPVLDVVIRRLLFVET